SKCSIRRSCANAVAFPALERDRERVLESVLGEIEVAEDAREDRKRASPLLLEDRLDYWRASTSAGSCTTGRTSIVPPRADGIFAAHSIASSSDSASMR